MTVPDIGGVLPVYVADSLRGLRGRALPGARRRGVERYIEANVRAVREWSSTPARRRARQPPRHGPGDPGAGAGGRVPYAVKVHGSALEYTVRPHRERFLPYALEGLRGAAPCSWARGTPPRASGR